MIGTDPSCFTTGTRYSFLSTPRQLGHDIPASLGILIETPASHAADTSIPAREQPVVSVRSSGWYDRRLRIAATVPRRARAYRLTTQSADEEMLMTSARSGEILNLGQQVMWPLRPRQTGSRTIEHEVE